MSVSVPVTLRNVYNPSSTAPITVTSPEEAFRELWSEALRKLEQSMTGDSSQLQSLVDRMNSCSEAEDVCLILDETMRKFERFRASNTAWGKLRNKYLKPAIEILLLFNDAIAEVAASFPNVPGGKAVFVAFGVLLQATKGVSAYCDALMVLFEELNFFLGSLRSRLYAPSSLGTASTTIAIAILAHLLDMIIRSANLLSKRPWLGRLALYGRALLKDAAMQESLQRLRALTDLEVRAMTSEIRVDASNIWDVASETRGIALETQITISRIRDVGTESAEVTKQLLSELQVLNEGRIRVESPRGIVGRGVTKLIQGQKDLMIFLRAEREQRKKLGVFAKLGRVHRADKILLLGTKEPGAGIAPITAALSRVMSDVIGVFSTITANEAPDSIVLRFLSILLFKAPETHLQDLEKVCVNGLIISNTWKRHISMLQGEWEHYIQYATITLTASVSMLAVPDVIRFPTMLLPPSRDPEEGDNWSPPLNSFVATANYISIMCDIGSIMLGLMLVHHNRTRGQEDPAEAAVYMQQQNWSYFHYEPLAILYSLPYALLMWSMLSFASGVVIFALGQTDAKTRYTIAIVVSSAIFAISCLIAVWYIVTTWDPKKLRPLQALWDTMKTMLVVKRRHYDASVTVVDGDAASEKPGMAAPRVLLHLLMNKIRRSPRRSL